ncbi:hypothetical protein Pmani_022100 [Petrolisthes manimaculis]|uniref:Lipase domain-containing protein n=1 Tax=Petrolisthes manimaculis TaxID=1843537 RepID=A0AAE1PEP3_9EUCA|nr:hypothetical protein Pmani_022100 [Petrolisthes manimaculis]
MDLGTSPTHPPPPLLLPSDKSSLISPPPVEQCHIVYGEQMCFSLLPPWVTSSRPVLKTPMAPVEIGTSFNLYTRLNHTVPALLDPSDLRTILSAPFIPDQPFRIISHGYFSRSGTPWLKMMTDELLRAQDQNVIVVDWSVGAIPPYTQAVANIRIVGAQLAYLVYALNKFADVPISSFHLIGHSLGAHLSGQAGVHLQNTYGLTLPRITGLDPAEPYFNYTHPITRLDHTDAIFVDVIHTDDAPILGFPLSLGMTEPIGHLDFYPNGGSQPGCSSELNCHHKRAITYFTESIRQSCPLLAIACPSYESFIQGECWGCKGEHPCTQMGLPALPLPVTHNTKLYLHTHDRSPYCGYHYRITVEMRNSSQARDHMGEFAILHLRLVGNKDITSTIRLSEQSHYYEAGSTQRRVILTQDVGRLQSVGVYFEDPTWLLPRFNRRLYVKAITIEPLDKTIRWKMCFESDYQKLDRQYQLQLSDSTC